MCAIIVRVMSMIKLDQVSKIYNNDGVTAIGIQNVSLEFNLGEFVAITGESGSGKSTLLNVISMMDSYEEGELFIDNKSTVEFSKKDFADYRANYVSFIFQEYNLVDSFTVLRNVMLPLLSRGYSHKEAKRIALESIEKVGLTKVRNHKATHLSGGEKQRTVIARALVSNTPIIACDEPTGNLDSETAVQVINLLKEVSPGKLILYVTHDFSSIEHVATRRIQMSDSHLQFDVPLENKPTEGTLDVSHKAKTKFPAILSTGFRDTISTPKKSILSLLIAYVISLSSVGLLTGAFSLIKPASEEITSTNDTYADKLHHSENRVLVFGKGENGSEISSFEFEKQYVVDYGSVLTSQSQYTLYPKDSPYSYQALNCSEIGLMKSSYKFFATLGKAPEAADEVAIGVSKTQYERFATDRDAISEFKQQFMSPKYFTIVPESLKSKLGDIKLKPTGVCLVDDNKSDYTIILTKEGLQVVRDNLKKAFETQNNFYDSHTNPYSGEATYSFGTMVSSFNSNGYIRTYEGGEDDTARQETTDWKKIYVSDVYNGFDLTITLRGASVTIPHDSDKIVYTDQLDSEVYLHEAAFTALFANSKQYASIYTDNAKDSNAIVKTLLSHSFIAYRSDIAQNSIISMNNDGYKFILFIIGYVVAFGGSSILIAFLGSLILGAIYNSRKKDYAILLSLSFSQQAVRFINMVEMFIFFAITSLTSYLTFLITSGIAGSKLYEGSLYSELYDVYLQGFANVFNTIYSYLSSPLFIVIYFLFNVLFAFLVSTWIMNKFMKKTLANNLRKGGELLW